MFNLNSIYVQLAKCGGLNTCGWGGKMSWNWKPLLQAASSRVTDLKACLASSAVECTLQLRNTVNRYIAPHRVVSPIWRPGLKCSCCIYSIQIRNTVQKYSSEIQYTASRHVTALKAGLSAAAAFLGLAWNGQDCPNCRRWWQLRTECDSCGLVGMDWCSCRW